MQKANNLWQAIKFNLTVETLGGWHPTAVLQIKKLARAQARTTGKDKDVAIRHLFQRLAFLLVINL